MCTNQSDSVVTCHHGHIVSKIICQLLAPPENGLSLFYLYTGPGIFIQQYFCTVQALIGYFIKIGKKNRTNWIFVYFSNIKLILEYKHGCKNKIRLTLEITEEQLETTKIFF